MLVLSRNRDETIIVDLSPLGLPPIRITVVDVRGDKVRIGVAADKSIPVHREEVYLEIQNNGSRSPQTKPAGAKAGS